MRYSVEKPLFVQICAVPVLPEEWNCLLPAFLPKPMLTTCSKQICIFLIASGLAICSRITFTGNSFTTSPFLRIAFTKRGWSILPLLAMPL